jgi:VAD1 Analog of StAR-related lipid transfer domain
MTMATDSNLTEITLPTTLKQFVEIAWRSGDFMNEFLSEKLLEKEVLITDWSVISSRDDKNIKYERTISSQHPLPLSLPWLPLFVKSSNTQSLVYDSNCCSLHISEISTIKGLPFVDPYIITEWVVNEMPSGHCNVRISLRFKYDKQSWLQGMVESQSRTELLKFFDMWEINFCEQVLSFNFKDEEKDVRGLNKLAHLFSPEVKHPVENAHRSDTYPDQLRDSHSDKHSTEGIPVLICPKSNAGFECDVQTGLTDDKQPLLKAFKHHNDDECDDDDEHHACLSEKSEGFPISVNRCLNRLQDCLILKVYVAIIINLYAKIDVAALHGIEVNNWLR